ncbi:hypothetical protein SAMN06269185_0932 [Natronoarchaeum philippinense]|uniref:Uncharacterized protein n=1 Tax=Natronoarchaeum philippinense TaxID=558529 RepID=A0A285N9Y8_NATPI|nr:hypothetical protein [Natronoarchaeum philippinense]SNZ05723.1 hypothetical protein SAMN06269185_0932 [Natronoarchaeum philippinense]
MSNDDDSTAVSTANTMRGRSGESRLKIWLLFRTNRFALTAVFAGLVFVSLLVCSLLLDPSLSSELTSGDTVETTFSAMLGAIITGTTLVVTISQLVLSQENGPLGDQRERMSDTMDYRNYAKDLFETVVPADPSAFLSQLVEETERRAEVLDRIVRESDNDELVDQTAEFVDSIHGNAHEVQDQLEGSKFGTFDVLFAALNFNYAWKIYQVERMTDEFAESLNDDQEQAFDDLRTALSMFGPAREHVKTLYFQWALIDLSVYIIYAAIPALIVSGAMLTFVTAETFTGSVLSIPVVTWVFSGAFTITLVPFLLFAAYILRIAPVAKRTLAIGPLILRDSQR